MESAGDTVAIPVLKPVLKYIVALFAGLAMPVGVYGMLLNVPAYRVHLVPFLLLAVLGAALGFVISEMVIRKSLRIPRTVWRGCAVTAAVCCLVVVGAKCDLTGYARRIPDTAQVKARASSATVTTPRSPRRRTFRPWRTSTAPSWRSAKRSRTTPASPVCS
ncbi:MAG: hypothetical protein ACLSHG_09700 [Oscillospiraceae bacterium]